MSSVARSHSLVDLLEAASASVPSLSLVMGGKRVAEEDDAPPVTTTIKVALDVLAMQEALPVRLRPLFRAERVEGFVKLTRRGSTQISRGELGENLLDATRALIASRYEVWPASDGCSLEVSREDAPQFIRSAPYTWTPDDEEVL